MNRIHFVYTHVSPSGKVYVGQTVNIKKRWGYNGEHYTTKKKDGSFIQASFARAIEKYGWKNFKHNIVLENVSKSEADYAEKYLIRWYKIHGLSYNITDGGEGCCGIHRVFSEEERRKISERVSKNPPMKGKKHTPEAMAKIIAANRNRQYTPEQRAAMAERARLYNTGKTHSEESKKKMSDYRKAHPETWIGGWNKKEVHQYDLEGKYMHSFPSAEEAANALGKSIGGDIGACVTGKKLSAGGFFWRDYKVESIDVSKYKVIKTSSGSRVYSIMEDGSCKMCGVKGKAVNQYSLEGNYIATYCSASDANRKTGVYRTTISHCCNHDSRSKTAGGYLWEYDTIDNRIKKEVA